jgi:hypothetical protein
VCILFHHEFASLGSSGMGTYGKELSGLHTVRVIQ